MILIIYDLRKHQLKKLKTNNKYKEINQNKSNNFRFTNRKSRKIRSNIRSK